MTTEFRALAGVTNAGASSTPVHRPWYPWYILVALILALVPLAAPAQAAPLAGSTRAARVSIQAPLRRTTNTGYTRDTGNTGTYTNPIDAQIPMSAGVNEDCPDPSIIHGQTSGDTEWYAYCTSGPLNNNDRDGNGNLVIHRVKMLSSHDLVTWTYRGDVLGKSSDQPSTRPSWLTSDNTFAPDIRYFNNKYYLYYSAPDTTAGGPAIFVVTSTTPLGPWTAYSTPVVEPEPPPCCTAPRATIDPALVTDDATNKTYIFYGSYYGGISARRLSADGLSSSTSETTVMTGVAPLKDITIANRYEGSYVVKHGGYYYLFVSATNCCNGPLTHYGLFAGRSPNALGPYVDREGNSFLSGRVGGTPALQQNGNRWVGPGHNAVFTDAAGQDWFLYHAVDRHDPYFTQANGSVAFTKRPLMMDPLDWGADGWPVARGDQGPSDTPQPAPAAQPGQTSGYTPTFTQPEQPGAPITALSDEFNGSSYGPQWTWVRGNPSVPLSYTVSGGSFNFDTQPADLQPQGPTPPPAASVLTEPTPPGDFIVDTKVRLNLPPEGCCQNYVQAGMVIYGDNSAYVKLVHVSIFETRQTEFGKHDSTGYGNGVVGPPSTDTYLRIVRTHSNTEELYRAYSSQDGIHYARGGVWTHTLGSNAKIGLVSMGGSGYTANFDYVRVYQLAGAADATPTVTVGGTQTVTPTGTVSGTQTVMPTTTVSGTATAVTTPAASSTATSTGASAATATGTTAPPSVTNTAVPATATRTTAPPTATNTTAPPAATGTTAPPTATRTARPTHTPAPTPRPRICTVKTALLYVKRAANPLVTVYSLRGTNKGARSDTPLFYDDGRVTFTAGRGYSTLDCVVTPLLVRVQGTVDQGRRGVGRGATFTLTLTADRRVGDPRRPQQTYQVELRTVERKGNRTARYRALYRGVLGVVSLPVLTLPAPIYAVRVARLYPARGGAALVTVDGLRGTATGASSSTALSYDGARVSFQSGLSYASLQGRVTPLLVRVQGTVDRARRGIARGATFTLTLTEGPPAGPRGHTYATYRVELRTVERRGARTYSDDTVYNGARGTLSAPTITQ